MMVGATTAAVSHRLRESGPYAGFIQHGSWFGPVSYSAPFVTVEDATVPQTLRNWRVPELDSIPKRFLATWQSRQLSLYNRAAGCCMLSHWAAQSVQSDYELPPSKVHVVGIGRNLDVASATRDWHTPRFLFIGKDWERKNGPAVVEAFRAVRLQFPAALLDVVAGHPIGTRDGVTYHGLLNLAKQHERDALETLLRSATCFVMPSLYEPSATVYSEAMAAGVGVIGTVAGGSGTIIGDAGLLVEPHDGQAIIAAMLRFCQPEEARSFGARGSERAALFTWKAVAGRLLRALLPSAPFVDSLPRFL
jgi:glycosyltransferase involved in cell wall biosynthesis